MIQGLLSINQVFQPSKCQVVSARLCSPNFPVTASAFMGIQPVAGEIRSPEPTLLSRFSHFLTLVGIEYPLEAPKSFPQLFPSASLCWSCQGVSPLTSCQSPGLLSALLLALAPPGSFTSFTALRCFLFSWTEQRKIVQAS